MGVSYWSRSVEQLHVYWREECTGPPASALQNLSYLAGCSGTICTFLLGRTITHLRWQPCLNELVPDIDFISSALHNLHVLVLHGPDTLLSLSTIIDYLPNLQFLELKGHWTTNLLYIH